MVLNPYSSLGICVIYWLLLSIVKNGRMSRMYLSKSVLDIKCEVIIGIEVDQ